MIQSGMKSAKVNHINMSSAQTGLKLFFLECAVVVFDYSKQQFRQLEARMLLEEYWK